MNYEFEFDIPKGIHCLSNCNDSIEGKICFLVPPHYLKARFHLPLHPFIVEVLNDFKVAPNQLTRVSWWILIDYILLYKERKWKSPVTMLRDLFALKRVAQNIYEGFFQLYLEIQEGEKGHHQVDQEWSPSRSVSILVRDFGLASDISRSESLEREMGDDHDIE
ncbi:hypothetical protein V6N12_013886 [Hibiscus sabdariffa]|uniref:Uncharacterized protein n=1 Tax=Hibiscus sabdariffa TaxID=183260 RepID=A0ABR1ZJY9_9ROSI